MFRKIAYFLLASVFLTIPVSQVLRADSPANPGDDQAQGSFPFDDQCLKFDKASFKVGQDLIDVMTMGDFPQFCTLYSLSNYHVKQKADQGYYIAGSRPGAKQDESTTVFLKSNRVLAQNQVLKARGLDFSNLAGQWAYFVGEERYIMNNGDEKEFYTFQEIDF